MQMWLSTILTTCGIPPTAQHEENSSRTYTIAEQRRDGCTIVFRNFLLALVDMEPNNLDQTTPAVDAKAITTMPMIIDYEEDVDDFPS